MYAITVQQPWAEAIARHGCNVLNRSRRPPAHLIGQWVAIHVGKARDKMGVALLLLSSAHLPHLLPLCEFALAHYGTVPNAGRIIATARLVGWRTVDQFCPGEDHADGVLTEAAKRSPWFTGPVGWVLADVRALVFPVGQTQDCATCPNRDGYLPEPRGYCLCSAPIRGQVYPFALSPEIEAAILRQEG